MFPYILLEATDWGVKCYNIHSLFQLPKLMANLGIGNMRLILGHAASFTFKFSFRRAWLVIKEFVIVSGTRLSVRLPHSPGAVSCVRLSLAPS